MIIGKTLVKCAVFDKPVKGKYIRAIGANVTITATESKLPPPEAAALG